MNCFGLETASQVPRMREKWKILRSELALSPLISEIELTMTEMTNPIAV